MRRVVSISVVVFVLLLGACGDDDGPGDDATSSTSSTSSTTAPEEVDGDGATPVGSPSTDTVEADGFPRISGDTALLGDVRIATHDGFDRVVLEFEDGEPPSYRVGYVDPPVREDFSGHEVEVDGGAFLEIRAAPAAGFDPLSEDARETYTGPRRLSPERVDLVREAVRIGDFEGQLAWVVGVAHRAPFGVTVLEEPLRLVVDIVAEEPSGVGADRSG